MPFGLRNAAQSFQQFMDQVLRDLDFAYAYQNDVLIASSSHDEHIQHLHAVLKQFSDHGVVVNPGKCEFGVPQITFLGHLVNCHGIRPLPEKVEALRSFPRPSTQRSDNSVADALSRVTYGAIHNNAPPVVDFEELSRIQSTDVELAELLKSPSQHSDCSPVDSYGLESILMFVNGLTNVYIVNEPKFTNLHIDLVGPLPQSQGFTYLLTIVDQFTRWVEATPLGDISADTVAQAFVSTWVSRFRTPTLITTDQGHQFESTLRSQLMKILGTYRSCTTAYHPSANGLVEGVHRQLKAAIKCLHSHNDWVSGLPWILLGFCTAVKKELGCSSAELVYGTTLQVPGELISPTPTPVPDPASFATKQCQNMQSVKAIPPRSHIRSSHLSHSLSSTSYVLVRHDAVKTSLQQPYDGPYKVVKRNTKYYTILMNGRTVNICIDRLKPAFLDEDQDTDETDSNLSPTQSLPISPSPSSPLPPTASAEKTTRSGHRVHWPKHLATYC
uniref:Integrase catalytic domain-containing protein n=1 Tax=Amphimedon queenslandica TaxID=400682 RepID=A0A1X7V6A1_AMPQE